MKRIASIDIFRALTMITMIFVNDYAGMGGLPHWLHHADFDEDMLGFSDLVFPAFLFCVGMSIPFAVGARFNRGASQLQVLGHIALRTLALLVMGIFSMNMRGVEGGLSHAVFSLMAIAGYFLIWNAWPKQKSTLSSVLHAAGIILLIGLVVYKDLHGMPFRHGWWGILGLIAWAYLPCAVGYLCLRGDFRKVMIFSLLTLILCLLNASPAIPADWSSRAVILGFWPGGWTHPAICAAGMMTSMLLIRFGDKPRSLFTCYAGFALAMFLLGLVSHRFWIISKIQATPTWLFFCVAISVLLFSVIYWMADLKGHSHWARLIAPAGTATLTCYMMPSIWYDVQQLLGLHWPEALSYGLPGLIKALVFAFIIVALTGLFEKIHLKLKL